MSYLRAYRRARFAPLAIMLFSIGCMEYEVRTTLNPDGSGVRSEKLVLEDNEDEDLALTPDAFRGLMHVREVDGFKHSERPGDSGTRVHQFTRETAIRNWDAWRSLSGRIQIAAAADARAGYRAGVSDYADVRFENSLQVNRRENADGRTVEYRERFSWSNLAGVLIEFEVQRFRQFVQERYPRLKPESRGELIGLAMGALWATAEEGRWDMGDSQRAEAYAPLVEQLSDQALRLVRDRYPQADRELFATEYRRMLVELEEDEDFEDFLERKLPGAVLAGNTQVVMRLNLPGRVLESNAHDSDGDTLVWEFSPWDAVLVPIELFARSRLSE